MSPFVLDDYIRRLMIEEHRILEERIKLVVRPRPRWLPRRVWKAVIQRLLVVEHQTLP